MSRSRIALVLGIIAACALPFAAFAQTDSDASALLVQLEALQQQLQSLSSASSVTSSIPASGPSVSSTSVCPVLSRTLSLGVSGSDVANLQSYLAGQGLFSAGVTAYFGTVTQGAVQQWQEAHGVVAGGSPDSTGWGVVGPHTRAAIAQSCGGQTSPSRPLSCAAASPPTVECSAGWQPVNDAYGCTTSYTCSIPLPPLGSCQSGYVFENNQCVQNACSAIALVCPAGSTDQIGANCSHTCVPSTTSANSCPQYSAPSCGAGQHVLSGVYNSTTGCYNAPVCVSNTNSCPQYSAPACSSAQHLTSGSYDPSSGCYGAPQCAAN
jgi:peptidoglycan hydrolase-like protein with peptidoglycan-binding domain